MKNADTGVASAHRVVRYDARGYGRSSRPEPGLPYSDVEDLAAVMDAAGVDRGALIGCSMGAGTAIEFTLTHPQRVTALVLVAAGCAGSRSAPRRRSRSRSSKLDSARRSRRAIWRLP